MGGWGNLYVVEDLKHCLPLSRRPSQVLSRILVLANQTDGLIKLMNLQEWECVMCGIWGLNLKANNFLMSCYSPKTKLGNWAQTTHWENPVPQAQNLEVQLNKITIQCFFFFLRKE